MNSGPFMQKFDMETDRVFLRETLSGYELTTRTWSDATTFTVTIPKGTDWSFYDLTDTIGSVIISVPSWGVEYTFQTHDFNMMLLEDRMEIDFMRYHKSKEKEFEWVERSIGLEQNIEKEYGRGWRDKYDEWLKAHHKG